MDEELLCSDQKDNSIRINLESELNSSISFECCNTNYENHIKINMYFPFWNQGDEIELSMKESDGDVFLYGKHIDSGIISKIKL